MFYIFFQITSNRMQRILPSIAPNAKDRKDIYLLCLSNIEDAESWLPGWFMNRQKQHPQFHEIHRDNMAEW